MQHTIRHTSACVAGLLVEAALFVDVRLQALPAHITTIAPAPLLQTRFVLATATEKRRRIEDDVVICLDGSFRQIGLC